jgi:nitrite reductase/ring-hydroxylating ferredoxin subunit
VTQCGASRERSIGRDAGVVVRTSLNNDAAQVLLARLEQIEDGGFAEAEAVLDGDAESLILHRDGGAVRAWLNVCPHAGRRLDWAPGKFLRSNGLLVCAAHGAGFELAEGQCVAGPCRGDRLRAVAIELRDGAVYLAPP